MLRNTLLNNPSKEGESRSNHRGGFFMHCVHLWPPLRGSKQEGTLTGGYALTVSTPGYYLNAPTVLFPSVYCYYIPLE